MMIVLVTKYRLTGCYCFIADSVHIFSTRILSLARQPALASWKARPTLKLVPPPSAANSSGNITGYQPDTERRLDRNVLLEHFTNSLPPKILPSAPIGGASRHHQFKWQYHPIPTAGEKIFSAFRGLFVNIAQKVQTNLRGAN